MRRSRGSRSSRQISCKSRVEVRSMSHVLLFETSTIAPPSDRDMSHYDRRKDISSALLSTCWRWLGFGSIRSEAGASFNQRLSSFIVRTDPVIIRGLQAEMQPAHDSECCLALVSFLALHSVSVYINYQVMLPDTRRGRYAFSTLKQRCP